MSGDLTGLCLCMIRAPFYEPCTFLSPVYSSMSLLSTYSTLQFRLLIETSLVSQPVICPEGYCYILSLILLYKVFIRS